MKRYKDVRPNEVLPVLPRDYIADAYRDESVQQIALRLAEVEQSPDLEALRQSDPDSYRMVVYSWA